MGYRGTVGAEMAGFDLLLSLSFAEGLPINLVEAGWAGTPVFATAVDGCLDLVPSKEYGILVDPALSEVALSELLASALSSPSEIRLQGERFQQRIEEHFSGAVWTKRLEELYQFT
jgi:glycosyltransferase involved in cell wall biosynthesis